MLGFADFIANFSKKRYISAIMKTKAAELADLLKDKKVFYVNIEQPDNQGSTIETVIEDLKGVTCSVEGDIITFSGNGKIDFFTILENAQIITNRTEEGEVVSTFAENGGLQVKSKENDSIRAARITGNSNIKAALITCAGAIIAAIIIVKASQKNSQLENTETTNFVIEVSESNIQDSEIFSISSTLPDIENFIHKRHICIIQMQNNFLIK